MPGPPLTSLRHACARLAAVALAVLLPALAPTHPALGAAAQSVTYGEACSGLSPAPTLAFSGSVVPGQVGSLHLSGAPPGAFVVLHAGNSNVQTLGGTPLPIDLSPVDGVNDGCSQQTNALVILILDADAQGKLKMDFPVPTSLGSDIFFQWFVVEELAPLSVTATAGLQISVNTNPDLHVVMQLPSVAVDHDGDGQEIVLLDGSDSHTHEAGHALVQHTWREGATVLAQQAVAGVPFGLGHHVVDLQIADDHVPAHTLMDVRALDVVPAGEVPGILARHHDAGGGDPAQLLDAVPPAADFAEVLPGWLLDDAGGSVGGSPFTGGVMVTLEGRFELAAPGTVDASASGGSERRLFVDGGAVGGPLALAAGWHEVEARFAVPTLGDLPLTVSLLQGGQPLGLAPLHDESVAPPVLHSVNPTLGSSAGGNAVVLEGLLFVPAADVVVHWGDVDLDLDDNLAITPDRITFSAPPHAPGVLSVSVETPAGTSNARSFEYADDGPVPVLFAARDFAAVPGATQGDWGPDGRFYVTTIGGELAAITFDDDLDVVAVETYPGVSGESNFQSLGLAFNPFDPPSPVRVYVSHALLSADGGGEVTAPSIYQGAVSILEGPDFDTPLPLITGLPQPNAPHQVNGLQFDDNGDLLLDVGSCTNAGVPWVTIGDLPESPLSAAVLKAETSRPDFNGAISYVETLGGAPNADQRDGGIVDVAPGSHVHVHAPGQRNPYDLVYTTQGRLYSTDNGPNATYGPQSTGASTQGADTEGPDELNLIEAGNYYGHPNRNRGRHDPRQDVYHGPASASQPDVFTQALTILASSVDGLTEYRSEAFGGQLRGGLIAQKWAGQTWRLRLSDDGRAVQSVLPISPPLVGLDVAMAPGGGLIGVHYLANGVTSFATVDATPPGTRALDITPWRAPDSGGRSFVIGGHGFGNLGNTTVTIGGQAATLTAVRPRRIEGLLPAHPAAGTPAVPTALQDVVVDSAGTVSTLTAAFRWLRTPAGNEPGRWRPGPALPQPLGEVAAAVVEGELYLFSHDTTDTLRLDLPTPGAGWDTTPAPRPVPDGGQVAVALDDELLVIGGHGAAAGLVQAYDHHDDLWSTRAPLPWAGGGVAVAVLDGTLWAAGGRVAGVAVGLLAEYDADLDAWTPRAPLPGGALRAHAALAAVDGALLLFGGVDATSTPRDTLFRYDPLTDGWISSDDAGPPLSPLPAPRSHMGAAIPWQGELYLLGGRDRGGPLAAVHAYDPATDTWRSEAPLPTPRHDTAPAIFQGRVFVAGGSPVAGHGHCEVVEEFSRQ